MSDNPNLQIKDFALIGAGPVGIFLSHLLVQKGYKVTLYEAGGRGSENLSLNLNRYIFKTKSKIPNGVHRVGGASNLWKRRISEFSTDVFNRLDPDGNRVWPIESELLDSANQYLFRMLSDSGLRDHEFSDKHLGRFRESLPSPFELNLFRFCDENFFLNLLKELESQSNFSLVTDSFVSEICRNEVLEQTNPCVELVMIDSSNEFTKSSFHSNVVLTGGCMQSTFLVLKSKDILNKLPEPNLVGKNLMEHFDGYVGTLRIKRKNSKILNKLILDEDRKILGETFGVGLTIPDHASRSSIPTAFHLEFVQWRKTYLFDPNLNIFNGIPHKFYRFLFFTERVIKKVPSLLRAFWFRFIGTEMYSVWLKGEEHPTFSSRLQISDDKDLRKIKLIYHHKVSSNSKKLIRGRLSEVSKQLKANNLGKFRIHLYFRLNSFFYTGPNFHPMGSLRMGSNPSLSVVAPNFALHGCSNIFAVNSGIFPNGSNHNPTAMVLALSVIFAEMA